MEAVDCRTWRDPTVGGGSRRSGIGRPHRGWRRRTSEKTSHHLPRAPHGPTVFEPWGDEPDPSVIMSRRGAVLPATRRRYPIRSPMLQPIRSPIRSRPVTGHWTVLEMRLPAIPRSAIAFRAGGPWALQAEIVRPPGGLWALHAGTERPPGGRRTGHARPLRRRVAERRPMIESIAHLVAIDAARVSGDAAALSTVGASSRHY